MVGECPLTTSLQEKISSEVFEHRQAIVGTAISGIVNVHERCSHF